MNECIRNTLDESQQKPRREHTYYMIEYPLRVEKDGWKKTNFKSKSSNDMERRKRRKKKWKKYVTSKQETDETGDRRRNSSFPITKSITCHIQNKPKYSEYIILRSIYRLAKSKRRKIKTTQPNPTTTQPPRKYYSEYTRYHIYWRKYITFIGASISHLLEPVLQ